MVKTITVLLLGMFLISLVSAGYACEDGEWGSVNIVSATDELDDNFEEWSWADGQDIQIILTVENKLNTSEDFTTEIVFLDDEKIVYFVEDMDDLTRTDRIRGENEEKIKFSFEIEDDSPHSSYNMFVKTYLNGNEKGQCSELEVVVKVNSFDSCPDDNDLKIELTDSNNWSWMFDEEQTVYVEVTSNISVDEYEIELIFYDEEEKEIRIVDNEGDLIKTKDITNGTTLIEFDLRTEEKLIEGDYGLYARVSSDRHCAEQRIYENYKKGRSTLQDYSILSIKDEEGVIVEDVVGSTNLISNTEQMIKVVLRNTGDDEEKVRVWAYNSARRLKSQIIIEDFKRDTIREIEMPISILNYNGSVRILFFAEYDYRNKTGGYYKSSTDYNHDINKLMTVSLPYVEPVEIPTYTAPAVVIVQPEEKSIIPFIIVIFFFGVPIIIWLVIRKIYNK